MSRDYGEYRVWNQNMSYGYIVSDKTQILEKSKKFPKNGGRVFTKKVLTDFYFPIY